MMIVAIVQGNLKQTHCIDLYADNRYIASVWGTAEVTYSEAPRSKYCLAMNGCAAFYHVDAIQRYDPLHPLPK